MNNASFHRQLYSWYEIAGRQTLPWRTTRDPYHIYLSEIMLQQTQVKTVLERYYFPFLEQFPTLAALAEAPLERVLKAWEGLGYYTRARNLHAAAKQAAPCLPTAVDDLLALPGIGKNTAHAIAAFAYKQPVPVLEANVKRIISRLFALENPSDRQLWQYAEQILDHNDPFTYNQAMMDIGAMVCTARNPNCAACPLSSHCQGKATPLLYPKPKIKAARPTRHRTIIVWQDSQNCYYIRARQSRFLNGLYGFDERDRDYVVDKTGELLGNITHSYSHFTLEAKVYCCRHTNQDLEKDGKWALLACINTLPLSEADKKALALLPRTSGNNP